jgi:hypothetical protein
MNERIKQLAEQATTKISFRLDPNNYKHIDDPDGDFERVEFDKQKFAELLVKECLKLCKEVEGDLAGIYEDAERDATQIGARFCYEAILSEFGVKE